MPGGLAPKFGSEKAGKKKQHKHKLFGPDFPRTFLTLTPGCTGVKKFLPTTGAAGKRTFWCGRPRFSARTSMTRRVVEKLCTKKICVDFLAPRKVSRDTGVSQLQLWVSRYTVQLSFQAVATADPRSRAISETRECPKDPAVLKTARDSELLRRSVFTTPPRFTTP